MSIAEKIRAKLVSNPEISPAALAAKLGTSVQNVYQVRHSFKKKQNAKQTSRDEALNRSKKTREQNSKPLSSYIITALESGNLTPQQLVKAVKKAGYVSHSNGFLGVLRAKLYELKRSGIVQSSADGYSLVGGAKPVPTPVADSKMSLSEVAELADFAKKFGGIGGLINSLKVLEDIKAKLS